MGVALAAIKHHKDGGFLHVIYTSVEQTVLALRHGAEQRGASVAPLPKDHLPHQDFGQEHVVNVARGCEDFGKQGAGGKAAALTVKCGFDLCHAWVEVVVADALSCHLGCAVEEMHLQRLIKSGVACLHVVKCR